MQLHAKYRLMTRGAVMSAAAFLLVLPVCVAQVQLQPAPREAHFDAETALPATVVVSVPVRDADDAFAASDLKDALKQNAADKKDEHAAKTVYRVELLRTNSAVAKELLRRHKLTFDAPMQDEGYVLIAEPHAAYIIGATGAGVFYGVQTLKQMLPVTGEKQEIPTGTIRDWPAMKYRGIDDDLSRGPFPTLAFQEHQIQVFASYKANVYSPYFEHTLMYPNEAVPALPGSSMTPNDVKELVAFAKQYHITVVPEQEAIGHLHQALRFDVNQDVAETPYGQVLAPGQPGTLPLIKDWFTQMAAEFPSPFLHIGADETWDLGLGLTKQQVQEKGYGPVYVGFLKAIHDELAPLHRRLMFWGDIGEQDPAAVAGLPKDMIAVPWNYGDQDSFESMIEPFEKVGIETWVAPGDSNWSRVYPDETTAFNNIQKFIRDGQKHGSTGALTTVWNDDGEGLFNMDWYGVLFGAVAAWQPGTSPIAPYEAAYGRLFHGDTSGKVDQAEQELVAAVDLLDETKVGMSSDALFWLDPWTPYGQQVAAKVTPVAKDLRLHAERAMLLLTQAKLENPGLREQDALTAMDLGARRLDLIGLKFEMSQLIIDSYAQIQQWQHDTAHQREARNLLGEISGTNGHIQDIRDGYTSLKDEFSQVWLSENRPYWLGNVTVRYDLAIQMWVKRGEQFQDAQRVWRAGQELPSAQELGMPAK